MVIPVPLIKGFWSFITVLDTRRICSFAAHLPFCAFEKTVFYFPPSQSSAAVTISAPVTDSSKTEGNNHGIESSEDASAQPSMKTKESAKEENERLVALTIDDGLCRGSDPSSSSLVREVLDLLDRHNAHATFFVCTKYTFSNEIILDQAKDLVRRGHELGNHLEEDLSGYYSNLSSEEFGKILDETNDLLKTLDKVGDETSNYATRWFRAPQGVLTKDMSKELDKRDGKIIHVLGDCYCDDWAVQDPEYISNTMSKQVKDGSIAIIHMPEKGFREPCFTALELFLGRLQKDGFRCVSLGEMRENRGLP